jgi:membrane protein implicated in regulation of membrane protease activity
MSALAAWLGLFVVLLVAEIAVAGSMVVLPFAVGALAGVAAAGLGADVGIQALVFAVVSAAAVFAPRPLAKRFEGPDAHLGATRLVGAEGVVTETITAGETGEVRLEREQWRAVTQDGTELVAGTRCRVADVKGSRLVVTPINPHKE